jgi:hypothetical protein
MASVGLTIVTVVWLPIAYATWIIAAWKASDALFSSLCICAVVLWAMPASWCYAWCRLLRQGGGRTTARGSVAFGFVVFAIAVLPILAMA